jgi:arylsulfatase A-like enzyme
MLRGTKGTVFEGGTRVPFVVRWPAKVKPGTSDSLMSQMDLLASFAALTDQTIPMGQAPDSENHLEALLVEFFGLSGPEVNRYVTASW